MECACHKKVPQDYFTDQKQREFCECGHLYFHHTAKYLFRIGKYGFFLRLSCPIDKEV